ncbi:protein of unknown function [Candidatus Nitrospira inopinata]|uniref:Uncharacterized protein n=1 Tax=Candidatus Nitrospira inopinata TaxID=1715989 RepID=A0A0S4KZG8_9BACT|nr:protein of unknown function [Candidatus Nitrospira inopinata]
MIPCIVKCDWIAHESVREGCRLSGPIHFYNEENDENGSKGDNAPNEKPSRLLSRRMPCVILDDRYFMSKEQPKDVRGFVF